jgi:activator of 2-hydroxyglutaryl-CoA dehydratase
MNEEERKRIEAVPPSQRLYCGVDVGASATKLILLDGKKETRAQTLRSSGVDYKSTAQECLVLARTEAPEGFEVVRTVSTGYGRRNVDFADAFLTEIQCHGVGTYHHIPFAGSTSR